MDSLEPLIEVLSVAIILGPIIGIGIGCFVRATQDN